jgi:hypothetical protein
MSSSQKAEYEALSDFHNRIKDLKEKLEKNCVFEQPTHPYEKFRNKLSPLFQSHIRESQKLVNK